MDSKAKPGNPGHKPKLIKVGFGLWTNCPFGGLSQDVSALPKAGKMNGIKIPQEVEENVAVLIKGYEHKIKNTSTLINAAQDAVKAKKSVCKNRLELSIFRAQKAAYIQAISDLESILDCFQER
jgi:hypothetical protein